MKIAIITTGGTIAMNSSNSGLKLDKNLKGALKGEVLETIEKLGSVEFREFANIPSEHMNLKIWLELAGYIEGLKGEYDAIVITHGTDTMEECAYLLYKMLKDTKIVLTGAMSGNDEIGSDGSKNLISAIKVAKTMAKSKTKDGLNVAVCMCEKIYSPLDIVKIDASSVDAFAPRVLGIIGRIDGGEVMLDDSDKSTLFGVKRGDIKLDIKPKNIVVIKAYSEIDGKAVLEMCKNADGVVIEGYGKGNLPKSLNSSIEALLSAGKRVAISSRVAFGKIGSGYDYEGGSSALERMGALMAGYKNTQMLRIDLALEN